MSLLYIKFILYIVTAYIQYKLMGMGMDDNSNGNGCFLLYYPKIFS